jgi:hypothetical protein
LEVRRQWEIGLHLQKKSRSPAAAVPVREVAIQLKTMEFTGILPE